MDLFSDGIRRDPYPLYKSVRGPSPVRCVAPPFDGWMIFDHEGVKRVLTDHEAFSSQVPGSPHWFIFSDPPVHTKLRGLVSRGFTRRRVAALEPSIRGLVRELLDGALAGGEMDMVADFSGPLPEKVIAAMIGIRATDWLLFKNWADSLLIQNLVRPGRAEDEQRARESTAATAAMNGYLGEMMAQRRAVPQDDLLSRLMETDAGGVCLSQEEILGIFQLLVVSGQQTASDLINNTILCLLENPDQLALLRARPALLPSAVEEVLRFRSPIQWVLRTPLRDTEIHGCTIPAGKLVLPIVGSASRDENVFPDADRFDITRNPNPHVAFGHGIHFCLGAALARMEATIALTEFMERVEHFEYAGDTPWEPRPALNVHGPARLPIRFVARG